MFVPVACLKCGKMFQVPQAAAGTEVACPWCKATTSALPVAGAIPIAQSEPLSLDDAEPFPPSEPTATEAKPQAAKPRPRRSRFKTVLVGLIVIAIAGSGTLALLRFGSGYIPPSAWSEFTPPDDSCTFVLPGAPSGERIEAIATDGIARGGERYSTRGWYSRTVVWVGWRDLDPEWVKHAAMDRDGALTAPVLSAERDRRKDQVGGTIVKEGKVRFEAFTGLEVQMETPRGKLVERYILALDGPRPRLYFLGIEGTNVSADSPSATGLFNSFRVRTQ